MSNIVDQVKEAVGLASPEYPAEAFQLSGKDPALHLEQNEQNQAGERPGKQSKMHKVGSSATLSMTCLKLTLGSSLLNFLLATERWFAWRWFHFSSCYLIMFTASHRRRLCQWQALHRLRQARGQESHHHRWWLGNWTRHCHSIRIGRCRQHHFLPSSWRARCSRHKSLRREEDERIENTPPRTGWLEAGS